MIERGEVPLDAAKRGLLEQTGFETSDWFNLGSYKADPNRGIGTRHLFLATNARRVAEPDSDDVEDQHLLSRAELMTDLTEMAGNLLPLPCYSNREIANANYRAFLERVTHCPDQTVARSTRHL